MSADTPITKDKLDEYLKELAKEFRKRGGKAMPGEIILIGGASILINYGFREMTYDMDAVIRASSVMKEAINHVGDKYNLPNGWLNADFMRTSSYTPKIIEHSVYYKTFSNVLTVRTVESEYLIAMKLMAGRVYKHDLSDIIGILHEHQTSGKSLSREQIYNAVCELYGSLEALPAESRTFIDAVMNNGDYEAMYKQYRAEEFSSRDILLEFDKQYPGVTNEDNVGDILKAAKAKKAKSKDGDSR